MQSEAAKVGDRSLASRFTIVFNIAVHAVKCCLCPVEMRHEETVMICQTFFKIAGKPIHLFDVMQYVPFVSLLWMQWISLGSGKEIRLCQDDRKRPRGLCIWAFWGWSLKGVLPEDFWNVSINMPMRPWRWSSGGYSMILAIYIYSV